VREAEQKRRRDAREQSLVEAVAQLEELVQTVKELVRDTGEEGTGDEPPTR
jgi:hypothetical protein